MLGRVTYESILADLKVRFGPQILLTPKDIAPYIEERRCPAFQKVETAERLPERWPIVSGRRSDSCRGHHFLGTDMLRSSTQSRQLEKTSMNALSPSLRQISDNNAHDQSS